MYGKLSATCVILACGIIPVSFVLRQELSRFIISILVRFNQAKPGAYYLSNDATRTVLIVSGAISILSALASIFLGHYSKQVNEGYGAWLNFIIAFAYLYFAIVLLVIYFIKNFSMSGYR